MRMKFALFAVIALVGFVFAAPAQNPAPVALAGRASSDAERAMEGVLVRAKGEGKTISITVVTDHTGRYSVPASRLTPGKYNIDIRAVGYDLASPTSVEVAAGVTRRIRAGQPAPPGFRRSNDREVGVSSGMEVRPNGIYVP